MSKDDIDEFNEGLSSMIIEGLRNKIGDPDARHLAEVSEEIENAGDKIDSSRYSSKYAPKSMKETSVPRSNIDVESALMIMYSVYENLIGIFEKLEIESRASELMAEQIKSISNGIRKLGGSVDTFDPLDHTSGLEVPQSIVNAQKVIDTTNSYYKMGIIEESGIKDENTIYLVFRGSSGNGISYRVEGEVRAPDGWMGSEAIDYVYTPSGGKLSVKTLHKGRWKDISDEYEISGEVEDELDRNFDVENSTEKYEQEIELPEDTEVEEFEEEYSEINDYSNINDDNYDENQVEEEGDKDDDDFEIVEN